MGFFSMGFFSLVISFLWVFFHGLFFGGFFFRGFFFRGHFFRDSYFRILNCNTDYSYTYIKLKLKIYLLFFSNLSQNDQIHKIIHELKCILCKCIRSFYSFLKLIFVQALLPNKCESIENSNCLNALGKTNIKMKE